MLLCRRGRNLKEGDPSMYASTSSLASADTQHQARRGLTIYLTVVVVFMALFDVLVVTVSPLWIFALMWSPAAASVVARLVLREGFADVSFRFGGRRTLKAILLALVFPIVIGLVAYGIAWATGLAQFDPQPLGLVPSIVGDTASPITIFVVMLAWAATIGTIIGALSAAGEEIGWRGYMLTRLIDAGVPPTGFSERSDLRPVAHPARPGRGVRGGFVSGRLSCAPDGHGHIVRLCDCTYTVRNGQHLASDRAARGLEQHHSEGVRSNYHGCWGSAVGGRSRHSHCARLGSCSRYLLARAVDDA
jgi:hypothetical protein